MQQYLDFLRTILQNGVDKPDRTGTGVRSIFAHQMRFDLTQGFPMLTTKKIHIKSVVHELLWFLRGETNVRALQEQGVTIWNEWADKEGELGPVYGYQWRHWPTRSGDEVDQIQQLINDLKKNPNSRRHIVSAWNVGELEKMALPPCHLLSQFYVANGELSCQLYQRSADAFLGVPFNIVSYALLAHMVAQQCDLKVREFIWTGGDCHIYQNHFDQVHEQLSRTPRSLPTLTIKRRPENIDEYDFADFEFSAYDPYPAIKAPIAV